MAPFITQQTCHFDTCKLANQKPNTNLKNFQAAGVLLCSTCNASSAAGVL